MTLREKVLEVATLYRKQHAPLTPQSLVNGVGASLSYGKLPDGKFGSYIEEKNLIIIDEDSPPKRQRFTLAHEVMHALIYRDSDILSDLHEDFEGDALEQELETLCNIGASELLLPKEIVEAGLAKRGQSPRLISELADANQVSDEVVIIAMAERGSKPSIILMAGSKPLRVYFSAKHKDIPFRISRGIGFRRDNPISVVQETEMPFKGVAELPQSSQKFRLEAIAKNGRIYAVYTALVN